MFTFHRSVFEVETIQPWKPEPLSHVHWPPDHRGVYAWRMEQLTALEADPILLRSAIAFYRLNPGVFIMHWMDTYDPRRKGAKWIPFVPFKKQWEYIEFLNSCVDDEEDGLVEKCRDFGVTWLSCAWSVERWLFEDGIAIGWGSRKEILVDKIGDLDSIFEKMRQLIDRIPKIFLPKKLKPEHLSYMKIINPDNGASITGEAGDNIGRGGRKKIYFKDESAHYPRPDLIEAALGDNTRVQIDISSVNGLGNVFERKRSAGVDWPNKQPGFTRVFVCDWSDHPEKTVEWYLRRKAKAERDGLQAKFAQEVDRNYSAAVSNAIIPFDWIVTARDLHLKYPEMLDGGQSAGFDVADSEDGDRNALVRRKGVVLLRANEWGSRDPGVSARQVISELREFPGIVCYYDSVGMGVSVKAEWNRLCDDEELYNNVLSKIALVAWNAGDKVQDPYKRVIENDPDSEKNIDFFGNMKAQAWFSLRMRFLRTWQFVTQGIEHPFEDMISTSTDIPLLHKLEKELAQPTETKNKRLQMIIDKKPDGMASPNLADSAVMAYFPIKLNHAMSGK